MERKRWNFLSKMVFPACLILILTVSFFMTGENRRAEALNGYRAGLNTMEHPELLPFFQPDGTETKQFISYSPTGGNGDGSFDYCYFKYIDSNGEFVIFDEYGPGCLYRQQFNVWFMNQFPAAGNAHIKYYFDNATSPAINMTLNDFFGGSVAPFTSPFCFMNDSKFFAIEYYPFAFRTRLKVTTDTDFHALFGSLDLGCWYQYTYHTYPTGTDVQTWSGTGEDSAIVRNQWNNLGVDPKDATGNVAATNTLTNIPNESTWTLLSLTGQGSIASLKLTLSPYNKSTFYNTRIKIYWDGSSTPSVDLPLGYFFGGGGASYSCSDQVWNMSFNSLFMGYNNANGTFYSYWPMPYWSSARIDIQNNSGATISSLRGDVNYKPLTAYNYQSGKAGYFCAKQTTDNDVGQESFVNVFSEKGKGQVVGMTFYTGDGYAMDGDEFTYLDGSRTPQMHGDGTEDDHNQGWGGMPYQKPLWGGLINGYQGAYRYYMNDSYVFNSEVKINYEYTREGGVANGGSSDVTTFYYKSDALNATKLKLTDQVNIADASSESSHSYTVSGQTWNGTITSGYEGYERNYAYDVVTDDGRAFNGYSQFTVAIDPGNSGVKLRKRINRTSNGVQQANVYVDGVKINERPWYVCDLGTAPDYQSWYDTNFDIPASYTAGKSSITVKIEYVNSLSRSEINEYYYWVYSYVQMATDTTAPGQVSGFSASAAGANRIDLGWNSQTDPSGVKYYKIYRSTAGDFSNASCIVSSNATKYPDTTVKPNTTYYYKVSAVDVFGNEGTLSSMASAVTSPYSSSSAAAFIATDDVTSGDWSNMYGSDGFLMPAYFYGIDNKAFPSYLSAVDYGTMATYQFATWNTANGKCLTVAPGNYCCPYLGTLWTGTSDTITLYVNDTNYHQLALYICDFDNYGGGRNENVQILDLNNNVLASANNQTGFGNGRWIRFSFQGSVKIRLTNNNPSANAVLSAIMFDSLNLAEGKTYSASSVWSTDYSADKAFDGSLGTRWSSAGGEPNNGWLQVDFGETLTFNKVIIKECITWNQSKSFKIQYWNGSQWLDAYTGNYIGTYKMCEFNPVRGSKMRILFTNATGGCASIFDVKVFNTNPQNLAMGKAYSASTVWGTGYGAEKAFDGNINTRWSSAGGEYNNGWLQVDFGVNTTFNQVVIKECTTWNQTTSFKVQYWNGSQWLDAYTGTAIGPGKTAIFDAVTGSKMRILFTGTTAGSPSIWEVEVYNANLDKLIVSNSSAISYAGGYIPALAFDNNGATFWQAIETSVFPKWLQADLGASVSVNKVRLRFYGPNHTARDFEIRISDNWDGSNYQVLKSVTGNVATDVTYTFPEKSGRYVRLYVTAGTTTDWWNPTVNEMEIWGKSSQLPGHTDDFSSSVLDSAWSWVREDSANWSLTARPGNLRIACQSGDLYTTYNNAKNLLLRAAPAGDWTMTARMEFNPAYEAQQAGLLVYKDDDNYLKLTRAVSVGQKISGAKEINAAYTQQLPSLTATNLDLKITKAGTTYTMYYSSDGGSNWTQVAQYPGVDFGTSFKVGLGDFGGPAGVNADFEWFDIR